MILVKPSYEIEYIPENLFEDLELYARNCYKSEDKITEDSGKKFIKSIIEKGHLSILRHKQITVRFICSRAVSHQLVRHGLAHFLQESQRYCNYNKKNDGNVTFIIPHWANYLSGKAAIRTDDSAVDALHEYMDVQEFWLYGMQLAEDNYKRLLKLGCKPEEAREVLPNSTKTEVIVTANIEEWIHIFKQRASPHADKAMQQLMYPLLEEFKKEIPIIFDNI